MPRATAKTWSNKRTEEHKPQLHQRPGAASTMLWATEVGPVTGVRASWEGEGTWAAARQARSACAQRSGEGSWRERGARHRAAPRLCCPSAEARKGRRISFLWFFLMRITGLRGRNHDQNSRDRKLKGHFILLKDKNPEGSSLVHLQPLVRCPAMLYEVSVCRTQSCPTLGVWGR